MECCVVHGREMMKAFFRRSVWQSCTLLDQYSTAPSLHYSERFPSIGPTDSGHPLHPPSTRLLCSYASFLSEDFVLDSDLVDLDLELSVLLESVFVASEFFESDLVVASFSALSPFL